jgi:hypothetical protein
MAPKAATPNASKTKGPKTTEGAVKIYAGGLMFAQRGIGKAEKVYLAALSKEAMNWPKGQRRVTIELPTTESE